MSGEQFWWMRRWEGVLDNLISYGLIALAGAVIAAGLLGSDVTSIPLWVVTVFVGIQLATVIAIVVLFRRLSAKPTVKEVVELEREPPKHPHAALLARINALDRSLAELDPLMRIRWPAAATFNGILRDAQQKTGNAALLGIHPFEESRIVDDDFADSGDNGLVRTMLAQIQANVEHPE